MTMGCFCRCRSHSWSVSKRIFSYKNKWWFHHYKSVSDTLPLRKRSDFKQALSTLERWHWEDGGEQFVTSLLEEQTMEVGIEFVFYIVGILRLLAVFLQFRRSSKRQAKSWVNGATRYWLYFVENLPRWFPRFFFVRDRSFAADSGLL